MEANKEIWFPAKRYGWGWGWPCAWQGWVVFLIYTGLAIAGGILLESHVGLFVGFMVILSAIFLTVVWSKGEKPRWRWGKED